jgi:hypothetical protein
MPDILLYTVSGILIVSTVAGAVASLLVIAVRVADTSLGENSLTTRAGRRLLRLYPVRQLAHWLGYHRLYDIAFAAMARDRYYQEEARKIAEEFAIADRQAFQIAEQYR